MIFIKLLLLVIFIKEYPFGRYMAKQSRTQIEALPETAERAVVLESPTLSDSPPILHRCISVQEVKN